MGDGLRRDFLRPFNAHEAGLHLPEEGAQLSKAWEGHNFASSGNQWGL